MLIWFRIRVYGRSNADTPLANNNNLLGVVMITEITKENLDEVTFFWQWIISIGPGLTFNDREMGFHILKVACWSPPDPDPCKVYWECPFTHSVDGLAKKQYFHSEKDAVENFLGRPDTRIFQLQNPHDLIELTGIWENRPTDKRRYD